LLFTGDKDFIRIVTTLRNRLGKRVVICGVPGSVSPDLVAAAGEEDPLQMSQSEDVDISVIRAIAAYVGQLHPGFVPTQSHMSRTLWRFIDRGLLPSEHIEAKVMEFLRKGILTKRPTINGQNQELITTELNPDHPLVQKALPGFVGPAREPREAPADTFYEDDEEFDEEEYDEDDEFEDDNVGNRRDPGEQLQEADDEEDEEVDLQPLHNR
jgi:hypothetical protein